MKKHDVAFNGDHVDCDSPVRAELLMLCDVIAEQAATLTEEVAALRGEVRGKEQRLNNLKQTLNELRERVNNPRPIVSEDVPRAFLLGARS